MRSLSFGGDEGPERWDICYGCFLVNSEGYDKKTRRVVRRILEKMESIAKPIKDATGLIRFQLKDGGGTVELEEVEFDLVHETIDKIRWTGLGIVKADKTSEWLESVQKANA